PMSRAGTSAHFALPVLAGLLTLLAVVLVGPQQAVAHATVESTAPAHGAQVDEAPAEVTVIFDESVSLPDAREAAQVIDESGDRVDQGEAALYASRAVLTIPLQDYLPHGVYVASWRVVSSDPHVVGGSVQFGHGTPRPRARRGCLRDARSCPDARRRRGQGDRVPRSGAAAGTAAGRIRAGFRPLGAPPGADRRRGGGRADRARLAGAALDAVPGLAPSGRSHDRHGGHRAIRGHAVRPCGVGADSGCSRRARTAGRGAGTGPRAGWWAATPRRGDGSGGGRDAGGRQRRGQRARGSGRGAERRFRSGPRPCARRDRMAGRARAPR